MNSGWFPEVLPCKVLHGAASQTLTIAEAAHQQGQLLRRQRLAGRDSQLPLHQVDARDALADGVLYLRRWPTCQGAWFLTGSCMRYCTMRCWTLHVSQTLYYCSSVCLTS